MKKHKMQHSHKHVLAVKLIPGDWKKLFDKNEFCITIAECLNSCIYETGVVLTGCLISYQNIYLVIHHTDDINKKMHVFYSHVKELIIKQHSLQANKADESNIKLYHLFRHYPMQNHALINLLTGKNVILPYFDPELERLKNTLNHEKFCSVVDYSGAEGSVIIKKTEPHIHIIVVETTEVFFKEEYLFE